jgi:hypothetical protein
MFAPISIIGDTSAIALVTACRGFIPGVRKTGMGLSAMVDHLSRTVFFSSAFIQIVAIGNEDLNGKVPMLTLVQKLRMLCQIALRWTHIRTVFLSPPFNRERQVEWQQLRDEIMHLSEQHKESRIKFVSFLQDENSDGRSYDEIFRGGAAHNPMTVLPDGSMTAEGAKLAQLFVRDVVGVPLPTKGEKGGNKDNRHLGGGNGRESSSRDHDPSKQSAPRSSVDRASSGSVSVKNDSRSESHKEHETARSVSRNGHGANHSGGGRHGGGFDQRRHPASRR